MKIATKCNASLRGASTALRVPHFAAFAVWFSVVALIVSGSAQAAVPGQPVLPPPSAGAVPSVAIPSPEASDALNPLEMGKTEDQSISKGMAKAEDKVIENAKNLVKKLDTTSDETTLEDLNKARQTISRIDAMIDVEKRLSELEKLRNERQPRMPSMPPTLASAIPASALAMPSIASLPSPGIGSDEPARVRRSSARPTLTRIIGTNGRYSAVLKFTGDNVKTVRVGEKVSDGETVQAITQTSVQIGGRGTSYTLHVKNVDVVYSVVR